jgi:hypothetical protein
MPRAATRYQRRDQPTPRSATKKRASELNSLAIKDLHRKLASKPVVDTSQQSDDSDGLVVKAPGSPQRTQDDNEVVYASGALGSGDKPKSHSTRTQQRKRMMQATQNSNPPQKKKAIEPTAMQSSKYRIPREQGKEMPASISASVVRPASAQPTPSRDTSVLDVIKPRKRQNSILKRLSLEDSSLGLSDDSFALPDAESTPLPPSKAQADENSFTISNSVPSSSRKRKLGASVPVNSTSKPVSTQKSTSNNHSPEPSLPPQALSSLRASVRKQRRQVSDDEDDIMAPPASSSSSTSPIKPTKSTAKSDDQPRGILTKQLQDLMPTKRRKTGRKVKKRDSEFEIPEDSDIRAEPVSDAEEASIFLPKTRKTRKTRAPEKKSDKINQDKGGRSAKTKPNSKKPSTRITLSRTAGNRTTKSPSQQSTSTPTRSNSIDPRPRSGLRKEERLGTEKLSGGSPLKASTVLIEGKENDIIEDAVGERPLDTHSAIQTPTSPVKKVVNKWTDIDNWDMDFEEVEVWERSSEKDAR